MGLRRRAGAPGPERGGDRRDGHRRPVSGEQGAHRRIRGRRGALARGSAGVGRQDRCRLPMCAAGVRAPARRRRRRVDERDERIDAREAIAQAHHEDWARVVANLTRRFGDLDIAEEAAAEAFATAIARWPADGVPPNSGAWLTTTANRKAIDRIRRETKRDDKQREAQMSYDDGPPEPLGAIEDDRLRLIFTCCHPALAMEARVALTLAHGRRSDDARDRPRVPGAGGHDGPADHPGQGQDQGGSHPVSGAIRGGSPRTRLGRPRRPLPRLQRGLPGDRPRHRTRPSRPDGRGDPAHPPDPRPHA